MLSFEWAHGLMGVSMSACPLWLNQIRRALPLLKVRDKTTQSRPTMPVVPREKDPDTLCSSAADC